MGSPLQQTAHGPCGAGWYAHGYGNRKNSNDADVRNPINKFLGMPRETQKEGLRGILHFKPAFCLEISAPGPLSTETPSASLQFPGGRGSPHR